MRSHEMWNLDVKDVTHFWNNFFWDVVCWEKQRHYNMGRNLNSWKCEFLECFDCFCWDSTRDCSYSYSVIIEVRKFTLNHQYMVCKNLCHHNLLSHGYARFGVYKQLSGHVEDEPKLQNSTLVGFERFSVSVRITRICPSLGRLAADHLKTYLGQWGFIKNPPRENSSQKSVVHWRLEKKGWKLSQSNSGPFASVSTSWCSFFIHGIQFHSVAGCTRCKASWKNSQLVGPNHRPTAIVSQGYSCLIGGVEHLCSIRFWEGIYQMVSIDQPVVMFF